MSVLIKGMNMPKCCEDCELEIAGQYELGTVCVFEYNDYTDNIRHTGKLKNCPLVEIQKADVRKNLNGVWISKEDYFECSNCGYRSFSKDNFCSTCGAEMKGEKNG